ncbi:CRISPR-associated endonuclease Cas2 [Arcobacter roscoffensis]|uniref:CRISPR-associated endoribonuclease Cas2 n=1 Tax=Arcobacter roscoffensis TaxID=2961520 RepID=A0ABY5E5A2_9BACT|nr:CRISPR-associated endonuclease Cas2 [Arcobacter roscoffensis]UTJ05936.1 CRISPR-associated endonuclease Cas2 [Arcobacter roscoffensis]
MYTQIIVGYDISETKKRNKFFDELKDLGLVSIQKSVFWGYVLPSEKRVIKELFKKYCQIETDKAFIVNVTLDKDLNDSFGYDNEDFSHPESFEIV